MVQEAQHEIQFHKFRDNFQGCLKLERRDALRCLAGHSKCIRWLATWILNAYRSATCRLSQNCFLNMRPFLVPNQWRRLKISQSNAIPWTGQHHLDCGYCALFLVYSVVDIWCCSGSLPWNCSLFGLALLIPPVTSYFLPGGVDS